MNLDDSTEIQQLSDDDEEPITAQRVLEILEKSWMNEKFAPEILPHQSDLMDLMLGQISHMEENMGRLDKNDFRSIAHRMELERIRYIVASYLRCRLAKIETYTQLILKEEEGRDADSKYLSEEETKFANEYLQMTESHFNQIVLRHIPESFHDEPKKRMVKPNLMGHVFVRAVESVGAVVVNEDDEEVELKQGSQHIVPYRLVSDLLLKKKVDLI